MRPQSGNRRIRKRKADEIRRKPLEADSVDSSWGCSRRRSIRAFAVKNQCHASAVLVELIFNLKCCIKAFAVKNQFHASVVLVELIFNLICCVVRFCASFGRPIWKPRKQFSRPEPSQNRVLGPSWQPKASLGASNLRLGCVLGVSWPCLKAS